MQVTQHPPVTKEQNQKTLLRCRYDVERHPIVGLRTSPSPCLGGEGSTPPFASCSTLPCSYGEEDEPKNPPAPTLTAYDSRPRKACDTQNRHGPSPSHTLSENPPPRPKPAVNRDSEMMASQDSRTQDWVLELHSLDSLDDPGRPATLNDNDSILPRWSTELTPGDGEPQSRSGGGRGGPRPPTPAPSPLPGATECLDFVVKRSGRWRGGAPRFRPARQTRLRNSLLAAVGFLEFANACDFAANVCT